MSFAENVKSIKKQKKITNEELAQKSGIPMGTLGKLLSGITEEPKLSTAVAIADALDSSILTLIGRDTDGIASLSAGETEMLSRYRVLDAHGREIANSVINIEYLRMSENAPAEKPEPEKTAEVLETPAKVEVRRIPLYELPVSAGTGEFLDSEDYGTINIRQTGRATDADYALRINGDSMMPEFQNGDILLVHKQEAVNRGQLGIFVGDGEGFFKKFGGDRLISLNPEYDDISLSGFTDISCRGLVIGKIKHAKA